MRLSEKRVVITGANGFVGRHLVNALREIDSSDTLLKDISGNSLDSRKKHLIKSSLD